VAEQERSGGRLPQWLVSWASIVTPASILSALLFYFGYASARAQYEYFGIDVDTIGLSTQAYIMRSPQALLTPLLAFTLLGAGLLSLHIAVRKTISVSVGRPSGRAGLIRMTARGAMIVGVALIVAGVVLLLAFGVLRYWPPYNLVTPLAFTTGAGLAVYAWRVSDLLRSALATRTTEGEEPNASGDGTVFPRRAVAVFLYILLAVSLFWATATVAEWSGRGEAQDLARNLDRLPRVILDTKERLYLRSPGVEESILRPSSEGQTFHYRYRRLRLLIVGGDRMFLVPETWSASNSTLMIPVDDSVRVQFQFQNQPP
jgi:hypothetical protein